MSAMGGKRTSATLAVSERSKHRLGVGSVSYASLFSTQGGELTVDLQEGRGPKPNCVARAVTWGGLVLLAARLPAEMLGAAPIIEDALFLVGLLAVFGGVAWQERSARKAKR